MYVIIYCGYEGIDGVLWAGADAEEAATKVKEIRRRVKKNVKENHPVTKTDEEDGHEYTVDSILGLPSPWCHMQDPNRVCVQTEDPERDIGFSCCCAALKVATKRSWLY